MPHVCIWGIIKSYYYYYYYYYYSLLKKCYCYSGNEQQCHILGTSIRSVIVRPRMQSKAHLLNTEYAFQTWQKQPVKQVVSSESA